MIALERRAGRKAREIGAGAGLPAMIGGWCFAFCVSVPNSIKVGPM